MFPPKNWLKASSWVITAIKITKALTKTYQKANYLSDNFNKFGLKPVLYTLTEPMP